MGILIVTFFQFSDNKIDFNYNTNQKGFGLDNIEKRFFLQECFQNTHFQKQW